MNILILNNTSDLYGGSRILLIVVQILKEGKHTPILVLSEDGPLVPELEKLGVEIHIIRLGILRHKYMNPKGILNRMVVSTAAWKSLSKLIEGRNIDLVYSNTIGVLIGAFFAKRKKIRHIWHVHEITLKPMPFVKLIAYLFKKYTDQIIVVSDAVKNHWAKYVDAAKLHRIYNGIDTSNFENTVGALRTELNIPQNQLLIGMIGRVNNWKGQDYFLEIAGHILKKFPDTRFIMVGDAYPGNEHLYDQLNTNLLNPVFKDRILNLGYRTDIANILNSLDIFILPSILPDPFPTVILEAMASGKPVVATNHGGATEMIIDGETGVLIPYNNAAAAVEKITGIIMDEGTRKAMGRCAAERINKQYSLQAFNDAILKIVSQN
ncbi:MAG: glycosyltransferase family 1 protein [Pedobacter sp.]|nr:MAG: glycosyltransferase family 1 protein [Pedobacter sp.]